jgi:hypothetical protein
VGEISWRGNDKLMAGLPMSGQGQKSPSKIKVPSVFLLSVEFNSLQENYSNGLFPLSQHYRTRSSQPRKGQYSSGLQFILAISKYLLTSY